MRRVTITWGETEALAAIQGILRCVVLLDQCSQRSDDVLFRRACIEQSNFLHDLSEAIDDAVRGNARAVPTP